MTEAIRIFDWEPPKQKKHKVSNVVKHLLMPNTPFVFGVFLGDKRISRHRSFYHAQTARDRYLRKYGNGLDIKSITGH